MAEFYKLGLEEDGVDHKGHIISSSVGLFRSLCFIANAVEIHWRILNQRTALLRFPLKYYRESENKINACSG